MLMIELASPSRMASARSLLAFWSSRIFSSIVSFRSSLYTVTCLVWPIRCALSVA